MKKWLTFLMLFPSLLFAQQSKDPVRPFSSLQADSIVIYDYNKWTKPGVSIVVKDTILGLKLNKYTKSQKLDSKKALQLTSRIESPKSYGGSPAACFDPHLGIVYYKKGKIVGYINVCMDCSRLNPSIVIPAQDQGKQISEDGNVYYTKYGMNESFKAYLNKILKEYDFSHQLIPRPFY